MKKAKTEFLTPRKQEQIHQQYMNTAAELGEQHRVIRIAEQQILVLNDRMDLLTKEYKGATEYWEKRSKLEATKTDATTGAIGNGKSEASPSNI